MKKRQTINLFFFTAFIVATTSLIYVFGTMNFSSSSKKPWHLQPSLDEDSLSRDYLNKYPIMNQKPLFKQAFDSSRTNLYILVDAWGVPLQEETLRNEFFIFKNIPHKYAIHRRLANRTKHAELAEFRGDIDNKAYLFGGDSTEYNRSSIARELGFKKIFFYQNTLDSELLVKIDSLLKTDSLKWITWTTQSSRGGNKDSLYKSLKLIAEFARLHPSIHIVIQGTHRPVLCGPEIRNSYKAHWVPVAILN